MRTNVDLDDTLVTQAMKISGINTKRAVLNMVLAELQKLILQENNIFICPNIYQEVLQGVR